MIRAKAILIGVVLLLRYSPWVMAGNGVNYEEAPINYSATKPLHNDVARLQSRLESSETSLVMDEKFGYLPSLLKKLQIPVESQALVFSKTSLQNDKIGPTTPRAIYFNDRIHLGYVQSGVIEIAAADSKLGMAFYTLDPRTNEAPKLERQSNRCMSCHGVARTRNVPGVLVRSVFPDRTGAPVLAAGSQQTTHRSPIDQRWGGWFVTGTHGKQVHLGNFILDEPKKPKVIDNSSGLNLASLQDRFDTTKYLRPTSDLVSLMVLEHQTDGYNLLTQANFVAQHAIYQRDNAVAAGIEVQVANQQLDERIAAAVKPLVDYLFFADEPSLVEPVRGSEDFVRVFESEGRRDQSGRSLRDLDLSSHLFKLPMSYLIYSPVLNDFPEPLHMALTQQIDTVLNEPTIPKKYWMKDEDKHAVRSILSQSAPNWMARARDKSPHHDSQ